MSLSPEESRRYARHLALKGFGGAAQQKLKAARVLVIGAGGLGSPVAAYLAAAGVGTLGIADHDTVAVSNLQRQIVHNSAGIGQGKAASAAAFVAALNPHVAVEVFAEKFTAANGAALAGGYDVLIDGSDNVATRIAAAEAADTVRKPLVSGAVSMFDGQVTVFMPGAGSPKYRDLYPHTPAEGELRSCEETGVLGAVTGVIGTLMAMEAIKLITGIGEPLVGRLLVYDGRAARFSEIAY